MGDWMIACRIASLRWHSRTVWRAKDLFYRESVESTVEVGEFGVWESVKKKADQEFWDYGELNVDRRRD